MRSGAGRGESSLCSAAAKGVAGHLPRTATQRHTAASTRWPSRGRTTPVTTQWSRSYGSNVSCSSGFSPSSASFERSFANTASVGAVESMHDALIEMTKCPPFFRK